MMKSGGMVLVMTRSLPTASASRRHHGLGFYAVAFAFLAVMAFSTVPSPLYGLYQARDGFSSFMVTVIYGAYAIGVVTALLTAGHVSDWHGRRRVLMPAIVAVDRVGVLFLVWRDTAGLIVARIVNGLSVGVVAATATAWLAELHSAARPDASPRRAQLTATAVNVGGLGLGPLVSGVPGAVGRRAADRPVRGVPGRVVGGLGRSSS